MAQVMAGCVGVPAGARLSARGVVGRHCGHAALRSDARRPRVGARTRFGARCEAPEGLTAASAAAYETISPPRTLPVEEHLRPVLDTTELDARFLRQSAFVPDAASALPTRDARGKLRIFSGSANPALAKEVACYLGIDLGKSNVKRFADGEVYVKIEESIRGCDVFLIQPTSPPVNDHLMELLIMIDACRRASARSVTVVMPYFGYARADRKTSGRESITAKLVANLITEAGAARVVALDLHSLQTIGYFDIPVDHIYGECVLLDYLNSKAMAAEDIVVVSPDVGGVPRARAFAKKLADAPLAIIDKRRTGHNQAQVMNLIGDVRGKRAIMLDDMIDTAGTLMAGAKLLRDEGATEVYACATHAVFSPPAIERLSSDIFTEVIVTNSIPTSVARSFPQLTVLSVANLLGETIWRVHNETSVNFNYLNY